jgi:sulfite oxidase
MWNKRDDMIVRNRLPYNAEPPSSVLASSEITPVDAFYVRSHGPFPDIAVEQWQLTVDGLVDKPLTLGYEDLTTNLPQHWVIATLACAGNRRAELVRPASIAMMACM